MKVLVNKEMLPILYRLNYRICLYVIIISCISTGCSNKSERSNYQLSQHTIQLLELASSKQAILITKFSVVNSQPLDSVLEAIGKLEIANFRISESSTAVSDSTILISLNNNESLIIGTQSSLKVNVLKSSEEIEYELVNLLSIILQNEAKQLVFIEGHHELDRFSVLSIEEALAPFFSINRGSIMEAAETIFEMDVLIIAGSKSSFSELEKYILDQYIGSGGKVLWLIDGAKYSEEKLFEEAYSPSMRNELNLDDLLFSYGVRINSDLVLDQTAKQQSIAGENMSFPWEPLLVPHSKENTITAQLGFVASSFPSSISLVNNNDSIHKNILLTSSSHALSEQLPIGIDLGMINSFEFNEQFIPVALSLEGKFPSAFANRLLSSEQKAHNYGRDKQASRMIVIANSAIIRNEIVQDNDGEYIYLPLGYSIADENSYDNSLFIMNCINWLCDDDAIVELRNKAIKSYRE